MKLHHLGIGFQLFVLVSAAAHPVAATAETMPSCPKIEMSQQKLACLYFMRNARELAENVGTWLKCHLVGKKTPKEEMVAAFKRYPDLYRSLDATQGRRFAGPGNQLMSYNTEEDMAEVAKKTLGFCYGHANVRVYLQRLTFFDPAGKFAALPKAERGSREWVKFYYDRIFEMLTKEEPQIIPGFSNLEEFSSDPILSNWLRYAEARLWGKRTARVKNVWNAFDRRDMTRAYSNRIVADLQERLDSGLNPIIMFNENPNKLVENWRGSMHVVTVVNVRKMENNRTAIIILDDKKPCGPTGKDCYDVLILNHKGRDGKAFAYFDSWRWKNVKDHSEGAWDTGMGTVNQIFIVSENDSRYMRMAMNMADFCKKNKTACQELGQWEATAPPIVDLPVAHAPYKEFKYALDESGQPARVEPMDFEQLKKTGLIDELVESRKAKNKKK